MKFSERMGYVSPRTELQIESMDNDMRVALWNCYWERFESLFRFSEYNLECFKYSRGLWKNILIQPLNEMPEEPYNIATYLSDWYFDCMWWEVYDFLEFSDNFLCTSAYTADDFRIQCNEALQKYASGYRFVGEIIAPITNDSEITSIEETLDLSIKSGLEGVRNHIQSALSMLSDRKEPDYRNSIKESISAVESVCRTITGNPKATLGDAIKLLKKKINIHPALEKGFSSIYGYASDGDGIRHAMTEKNDCDFEDAKYMLVSCSAFVNYLIMKAQKAGIDLSSTKK